MPTTEHVLSHPAAERADAIFDEITAAARQRMTALKVPGVAIGIACNGIVDTAGLGITNVDDPQPVTERTQFYIGSATKPFTATLALKMTERGEIDLHAPIRRYLPDFQVADIEASERARVLDVFQHHTGWQGDFFDDVSSGEDALEKAVLAMRFLPQRTPYGTVFAYQNSNYIIAGRLIQAVRRAKSYEQCVKEELLVPLGMSYTCFFMPELQAGRFAAGHGAVFDGTSRPKVSFSALPRAAYPAGALITTVSDLMKWIQFQFDGKDARGQQLLSPQLLALAHSPLVKGELDEHIGIAWFVEDIGGVRVVSHAGRSRGSPPRCCSHQTSASGSSCSPTATGESRCMTRSSPRRSGPTWASRRKSRSRFPPRVPTWSRSWAPGSEISRTTRSTGTAASSRHSDCSSRPGPAPRRPSTTRRRSRWAAQARTCAP
jgi:CubicO group peptidase (beta-lactamase class C family)